MRHKISMRVILYKQKDVTNHEKDIGIRYFLETLLCNNEKFRRCRSVLEMLIIVNN